MTARKPNFTKRIAAALGWTRASYTLMSLFVAIILLIIYVWWPLVREYATYFNPNIPLWRQIDLLLIGIFVFMSLMIMAHSDVRADLPIVLIGLLGGLVIESWGTQTELWVYYTNERPPLWIIPAWPIASLSIDRMYRLTNRWAGRIDERIFKALHWILLPSFYGLMLWFVWPTATKSLTMMALVLCGFLIITPNNYRAITLTFLAGSGLGYFLELWGTTRLTWTYYTLEQPPFFAVVAHGMAAVAFWRVLSLYQTLQPRLRLANPLGRNKRARTSSFG